MISLSPSTICIIDLLHIDSPIAWLKVLQPISKKVIIITSPELAFDFSKLSEAEYDNVIIEKVSNDVDQVKRILNLLLIHEVSAVVFNTIDRYYGDYADLFKKFAGIKLLVIHNINYWFQKKRKLKIFREPRNADHIAMLQMINSADRLIVLSDTLEAYLRNKYNQYKVSSFTTALHTGIDEKSIYFTDYVPTIIVPGSIEQKRKDFDLVLNVVEALGPGKSSLVLLGEPRGDYGNTIIARVKEMNNRGYLIKYFTGFIPEQEFELEMKMSDIVLIPVNIHTSFAGIREIYGQSKISGAVFDAIRYGKPAIVPEELSIPAKASNSFLKYSDEQCLINFIQKLLIADNLKKLTLNAIANAIHWQADKIRGQFLEDMNIAKLFSA